MNKAIPPTSPILLKCLIRTLSGILLAVVVLVFGLATPALAQSTNPPSVTSASSAVGMRNSAFSYTITATAGAYSYTITGVLPTGLTLNAVTGVISGTPTQSGIFNLTLNAINNYGVGSGPLTLTVGYDDTYGTHRAVGAVATNAPNQAPSFTLSFNWGSFNQNYPSDWNYYTITDTITNETWSAPLSTANGVAGGVSTTTWTDPRGLSFSGARQFTFWAHNYPLSYDYYPANLTTIATAFANGPRGQISAVQTNPGVPGPPSFKILVANENYGPGITSIAVDGGSRGTFTIPSAAIVGTGTVTWTYPYGVPTQTATFTFVAKGAGYQLPAFQVTTNLTAPVESLLTLSSGNTPKTVQSDGSIAIAGPVQPVVAINARANYVDYGSYDPDTHSYPSDTGCIQSIYGLIPGDVGWTLIASPNTTDAFQGYNTSWADPRGALSSGTYTYQIKTAGYKATVHSVDIDNGDGTHYTNYWVTHDAADPLDTKTITIVIGQAQTITFPAPAVKYLGDPAFSIFASASSGLPVTYSITSGNGTVASLSGATVTPLAVGSAVIKADQAGNGSYAPAPGVSQTVFVLKGSQSIAFTNPGTQIPGTTINLNSYASASSGQPLTYAVVGNASLSGANLTFYGTGNVAITAYQPGTASYAPAPAVTTNLTVINNPTSVAALTPPTTGAIAAVESHSVALKSDGTVWAWGKNDFGQLGDGSTIQRTSPVRVSGLTSMAAIATGIRRSFAVKTDGTIWGWGDNASGELGDGTYTNRLTPVQVGNLGNVAAVAAGEHHTVALRRDGTVWTWGSNGYGQLGDGTTTSRMIPVQVTGVTGVMAIAAGQNYTAVLKIDGTVWIWGLTLGNQWGTYSTVPSQVSGLSGVVALAAGYQHALAVESDGTVWAWGYGNSYQLGDGTYNSHSVPVRVTGLTGAVSVSAGKSHSVALKNDGTVWAWGGGTLGNGADVGGGTPVQASGLTGAVAVAAGGGHTLALKNDGTLWVVGNNDCGQLGNGTTTIRTAPVQPSALTNVRAVSAGNGFTMALKNDGTVWTWGYNSSGQLGDNTTSTRRSPVPVSGLTGVMAIDAGSYHAMALKSDGTVWTWGNNSSGQLGDATTTTRMIPVQSGPNSLSGIVSISAGGWHSVAVKSDGSVWAWGDNSSGQLGTGSVNSYLATPGQTRLNIYQGYYALGGIASASAGGSHTLALAADGSTYGWGADSYGQTGSNQLVNQPMADGFGLWVRLSVSTGSNFTVALMNDGTVRGFGFNYYGQVGSRPANLDPSTPSPIDGLTSMVAVAAGACHTVALKSDGTVWTLGYNGQGQLGDGTLTDRTTPVQVSGLTGVVVIAAGSGHTVALKSDGTVREWGAVYDDPAGLSSLIPQPTAIRLTASTADTDGDGMDDAWEIKYFGNLNHNGGADTDGDGLTDIQEFVKGSDPTRPDADGDLLTDFADGTPNPLPDTTPPTKPTPLNYADKTASTVTLVWGPSTDNVGVMGYFVYRDGTQIGMTTDRVFTDNGRAANTAYSYTVKASDAAGNFSLASDALSVTTTQDFSADSDHDGMPNATETALGTNGSTAASPDTTSQTEQNIHRPVW